MHLHLLFYLLKHGKYHKNELNAHLHVNAYMHLCEI